MVFCDGSEREGDGLVGVEVFLVDEVVEPPLVEECLHSAEYCLNGIELRAVGDIVDRRDVVLYVQRLYILRFVHSQIIPK